MRVSQCSNILLSLVLPSLSLCSDTSGYHEDLLFQPLPNNALLAAFNFRSNVSLTSFEQQHFQHFPRSFGQILQHTHTKELHLRFSLGRWDTKVWGPRPRKGRREGGTGVELWAWLEADSYQEANARWLSLTNALSGLFCASLNFIDGTKTIRPVAAFEHEGILPTEQDRSLHLLHGTLPHEVVCTENLTPFLKLLPCKGQAGIASLLDGHKLFDASWQTMAIDVRPIHNADNPDAGVLEIEQTVDMVLDLDRSKRPRDNPIPRPAPIEQIECDTSKPYNAEDTCYPLEDPSEPDWTLKEVFGRGISGSCRLQQSQLESSPHEVCLQVPADRVPEVIPENSEGIDVDFEDSGKARRCWTLSSNGDEFDITVPKYPKDRLKAYSGEFELLTARTITGYGQERGGIQTVLTNPSENALQLVYLESLPWYMKPYVHTLKARTKSMGSSKSESANIREIHYRPALDRHRGTHLELSLDLPPKSMLTLTYDFEKAILRYTEYPPDANRGFDVAPAVIRVSRADEQTSERSYAYVRTTSLLLPLPTPDFSMPYNVIILTSTVMALGFGGFFNLLVRRFVGIDELPPTALGLAVLRLKDRIAGFRMRIVGGLRQKSQKLE